jgi:hypothetical protein
MLKSSCGRIYQIDNITELPDPVPESNVYFIKDTGSIVSNINGELNKYGKIPKIGSNAGVIASLPEGSLIGNTTPTTKTTYFSYTTLEEAFYRTYINITFTSRNDWITVYSNFGLFEESAPASTTWISWFTTPTYLKKGEIITVSINSGAPSDIIGSRVQIHKHNIAYI